jgi:hypothetical protein
MARAGLGLDFKLPRIFKMRSTNVASTTSPANRRAREALFWSSRIMIGILWPLKTEAE